ncbi:winged helix-turn-helix transcriptional regulator [Pectobacterium brasiliense]|uniref:winged helix-turn-helix transcriptional regulator n=1 Tax=Pectobacterium brasiliense TaxID=180957 RepID=UPI00227A3789|nr:helix-turn-helix domain-containing protein [Pectobacterium brasiliense]WGL29755.1 helix-turn-helix domain-containing protein [Pectobacterium brasiliense]WJM80418.1 helix-turn-helix domain-containing protein [Pectobacterium brasiliense]
MGNQKKPCCGVARFLELLDGPWATLIVRELLTGPKRFTQLRDALPGISAHTLTNRLKKFEKHYLVTRTAFAETPPRVIYELTDMGKKLNTVLEAMKEWGDSVPDENLSQFPDISGSIAEKKLTDVCPFKKQKVLD